jgi:hypothetical protein
MTTQVLEQLRPFAARYIWWKSPEEAVALPDRVIAQVMNIGDFEDVQSLLKLVGENRFRYVLTHAEIGQFNARSWAYWHYRLGLTPANSLPPSMPKRFAA